MKLIFKILLLPILFLPAFAIQAQFVPDQLVLLASPESPSSGEIFTVQASTPTLDQNRLFFDWVVDGKRKPDLSGLGKNSIKLTAGNVGSVTRITANVEGADKEIKPASLNIYISDLALAWFAETYVPRWYKGKALPTQNSVVRVTAIPKLIVGGSAIASENLIYRWTLDDQENVVSGIGQQVFRFRMSDLPKSTHQIEVAIEDGRGVIHKNGLLILNTFQPQAKIYASSPLGGIEFRSSPSFTFIKLRGLLDFIIEPFFFNASSKKQLGFNWRVAGQEITGVPDNPHLITLDTTGQTTSILPISATTDDNIDIIPPAADNLSLIFQ